MGIWGEKRGIVERKGVLKIRNELAEERIAGVGVQIRGYERVVSRSLGISEEGVGKGE